MAIAAEAATSLYGAWRLAHLDTGGMAYFNVSVTGFWRSFLAAVLVAPLFALLLSVVYPGLEDPPDVARFASAESIGYVIAWVTYPLVMAWMTKRLGCWDRFIGYIVAYNWAAVLQNALFIPVNILWISGMIPPEAGFLVWLAAFAAILIYLWFIARTALGVAPLAASGIVALDILLSLLVSIITKGFH
ncbi:MAG: hypothetical protein EA406_01710 [Rhodospirillales bacterium]|nr:MAG: hypothetical protein EA406_01710 [Rhodospirillales bacterium]